MSIWKSLGWAAAGVGAIVAAPVTGGGSLALLIGAAGTTTAAGAALGGVAGLVGKELYDHVSSDSDEADRYRREAEANMAGWRASEEQRKAQAEQHQAEAEMLHSTLDKFRNERESIFAELKKQRFTRSEVELMYMLASVAAQADGNADEGEFEAAAKAIALLCEDPEGSVEIGRELFAKPMSLEDVMAKVRECQNSTSLERLGVVLEMVVEADGYIAPGEQAVLDAFQEHVRIVAASA